MNYVLLVISVKYLMTSQKLVTKKGQIPGNKLVHNSIVSEGFASLYHNNILFSYFQLTSFFSLYASFGRGKSPEPYLSETIYLLTSLFWTVTWDEV